MRTPRQRVRDRQRAQVSLDSPTFDVSSVDVSPAPQPAPRPAVNPELPAIQSSPRLTYWQVCRIEIHGDQRRQVLIAETKTKEAGVALANTQRWQTIVRHWRHRASTYSNWEKPKVVEPVEHCADCNAVHPVKKLFEVERQTARQTHSSPAEHENVLLCYDCYHRPERDADYERGEGSDEWQRRGGGGL